MNITPAATRFSGDVQITLKLARRTRTIWMHGRKLVVKTATLSRPGSAAAMPLHPLPAIRPRGLIGFELPTAVGPGTATLRIAFRGGMRQRTGLFHQRYHGRWYAYTDLEPKDARRAFPCFDDPRFKVPWQISVTTTNGNLAFANTPELGRTSLPDGRVRFSFARTRPLPSYLVAFAAGPFEVVPATAKSSVPLRIIALRGMASRAAYAAKHSPALLAAAERYFAMRAPYPKVDLIAVPYFAGAMENPGLITVGSHILLLPDQPSDDQRKMFAIVASHELAHLWFGDLVTVDYWNDLWLNEGFATWMSDKLVAAQLPKLGTRVEEVRNKVDSMMVARGHSRRPVRAHLGAHDRIEAAFDELTYKMAGALVTMFEARVGAAKFRRVLRSYIRKYADKVVSAERLFAALRRAGAGTEAAQLRRYVETTGFPLVSVEPRCSGHDLHLSLRQQPYGTLAAPRRDKVTWDIPVCIRFGHGKHRDEQCVRLNKPQRKVRLTVDRCPSWLMPNARGDGFYRYQLPDAWLTRTARSGQLSERERADFMFNLTGLMRANLVTVPVLVAALRGIAHTRNQHTLREMITALAMLALTTDTPRQKRRYASLVRSLVGRRARTLGLTKHKHDDYDAAAVRTTLVAFDAAFGHDRRLMATARRRTTHWLRTDKGIDEDALALTVQVAGMAGDARLFKHMEQALDATKDPTERRALARGLGSYLRPELRKRADALMRNNQLRGLEVLELLEARLLRPEDHARTFIRATTTVASVRKRWPATLRRYLPLLFSNGCSASALAAFNSLFAKPAIPLGEHAQRFLRMRARVRQRIRECNTTRAALSKSAARYFR